LAQGAATTILLDRDDNVTEGPGFNVFILRDGLLLTPNKGVLQGITRKCALEIAAELGLRAQETTVTLDALLHADEVFGTSTAGGVVPFGQIDDRPVGDGSPGPVTRRIRARLDAWYVSPAHTISVTEARAGGAVVA
jgi:branched-chain amino acid aminotransferase